MASAEEERKKRLREASKEKTRLRREEERRAKADRTQNRLAAIGLGQPTPQAIAPPQPAPEVIEEPEPPKAEITTPETLTHPETGGATGVTLPGGRTFLGLSPEEIAQVAAGEAARTAQPEGTVPGGTAQARAEQQFESQQLAGQVGEFGQLGIDPTGLNIEQALTEGVIGSIPSAIRLAASAGVGAAALGAVATAPAGGIGAVPAAAIGASAGFVAGIVGGMTSSFKGQRRSTTTAQQRTLDEGKQTMADWARWAQADPGNKAFYLSQFNQVSAQIDQAYRQMKLDTSRDLGKFETALPNLAEFEAFYAGGGERDELDSAMRTALLTPSNINYDMLEMANRRGALK